MSARVRYANSKTRARSLGTVGQVFMGNARGSPDGFDGPGGAGGIPLASVEWPRAGRPGAG